MNQHITTQKKTNKIQRIFFLFLTIMWMCVIFYFSSKTSKESSGQSHSTSLWIGKLIFPGFEQLSDFDKNTFAHNIDFIIRKTAHILEYTVLSILCFFAIKPTQKKYLRYIIVLVISVLYACFDEIHQLFVSGRAGMLRDVGIDAIGVCLGLLMAFLISHIIKAIKSYFHKKA